MQFNFSTEKEMLVAFASFVRAYDPDMYLGHNINGFDIPYLVVRANQIGVPLLAHLGRRSKFKWSAPREIISKRKNGSERKNLRVDTPGVVQIDTLPLMQGTIPKRPSYKLGYLGEKILGEGKVVFFITFYIANSFAGRCRLQHDHTKLENVRREAQRLGRVLPERCGALARLG